MVNIFLWSRVGELKRFYFFKNDMLVGLGRKKETPKAYFCKNGL